MNAFHKNVPGVSRLESETVEICQNFMAVLVLSF